MTSLPARSPLQLPDDHWHSLWLVLPETWARLHRVAEIVWTDDDMTRGVGATVCGRRGDLVMPGLLSRMGLPRCAHCCRLAGIPRGDGAPYNRGIKERTE